MVLTGDATGKGVGLAATFTMSSTLLAATRFWLSKLGMGETLHLAGYNQVSCYLPALLPPYMPLPALTPAARASVLPGTKLTIVDSLQVLQELMSPSVTDFPHYESAQILLKVQSLLG
jgi:hypothetical protein